MKLFFKAALAAVAVGARIQIKAPWATTGLKG